MKENNKGVKNNSKNNNTLLFLFIKYIKNSQLEPCKNCLTYRYAAHLIISKDVSQSFVDVKACQVKLLTLEKILPVGNLKKLITFKR